jgi:hypothetical protein
LKIKLKGHHFDTTEVIEPGLQAVLNTLTKHDFQDKFRKLQKCWEWCIHVKEDYFKGRPKVTFDRKAAPILEIMDYFVLCIHSNRYISVIKSTSLSTIKKNSINMKVTSSRHVSSRQTDTH